MKRSIAIAGIILLAWAACAAQLKIDVALVNVVATVTNEAGEYIQNLSAEDFIVEEDGRPQAIVHLTQSNDLPVSVGIVIDTSDSMQEKIAAASAAVERFLQTIHQDDDVFLSTFGSRFDLLRDFSTNRKQLIRVLAKIHTSGGTSLFDAVYESVRHAGKGKHSKRAILLITDGADTSSKWHSLTDTEQAIRRSGVLVYSIAIAGPERWNKDVVNMTPLNRFAEASGGKAWLFRADWPKRQGNEMQRILDEIAVELRNQYSIGYYPPHSFDDGKSHRVQIRTKDERFNVRSRKEYFGGALSTFTAGASHNLPDNGAPDLRDVTRTPPDDSFKSGMSPEGPRLLTGTMATEDNVVAVQFLHTPNASDTRSLGAALNGVLVSRNSSEIVLNTHGRDIRYRAEDVIGIQAIPLDAAAVDEQLKEARTALENGRLDHAIGVTEAVLALDVSDQTNRKARQIIADSYLAKGDLRQFEDYAIRVLKAGDSFEFTLLHRDAPTDVIPGRIGNLIENMWGGLRGLSYWHVVKIGVTRNMISFDPWLSSRDREYCLFYPFSEWIGSLLSIDLKSDEAGEHELDIQPRKEWRRPSAPLVYPPPPVVTTRDIDRTRAFGSRLRVLKFFSTAPNTHMLKAVQIVLERALKLDEDDHARIAAEDIAGQAPCGQPARERSVPFTSHPVIISNACGYDLDPYMVGVMDELRANWYSIVPLSARISAHELSQTVIRFKIVKAGTTQGVAVVSRSASPLLDRAARAAVTASAFPKLPDGYPGDSVVIQVPFVYYPVGQVSTPLR